MLSEANVVANVAVSNLEAAKEFYQNVLGLNQVDENPGGVMYESGGGKLFVYQSSTAGTGQATCASWKVSDVEKVAEGLKAKGVNFEVYDIPGAVQQGDVSVMGDMKAAWFKDPDGNILCVANG